MLHSFYQRCWTSGQIPKAWKTADVIGIPKEGKPANLPSSYRPIALTPHLGKLYERIVKERLQNHLDSNNVLPQVQAGFREGRSCMEHVYTLLEDIKNQNNRWRKFITTAAFFDIKKAFDCVWHQKLLDKLLTIGVTGRLYRFIKAFLDEREIRVKVGSATSPSHTIDMGVPQGSVIAPILFNIMLCDIDQATDDKGLRKALYADDLSIWASHDKNSRKKAMDSFQHHVDKIQRYMEENGFQLSPEKTVLMIFGRGRPDKEAYHIKIQDQVIRPSTSVKFLGVTIHQNLGWQAHFNKAITKAKKATNALKLLSYQDWATPRSLLLIARALVRSQLLYGHPVTFTAPGYQWTSLKATDCQAVKIALGLPRSANNTLTYQEAGWLPLDEEFRRLNSHFEVQLHANHYNPGPEIGNPPNRREKAYRRVHEATNSTTVALKDNTKKLWEESQSSIQEVVPKPTIYPKRWKQAKPSIITTLPGKITKKDNPNILSVQAKEMIATNYKDHLQVYTDGSIQDDQSTGSAATIPDLKISHKNCLNPGVSIFTAELQALHMACLTLLEIPGPPTRAVILSDSKSALQALQNGNGSNRRELQAEILHLCHQIVERGTELTLQWIPSHSGIRGNDQADSEAKKAARDGQPLNLQLSPKEMKTKLTNASVHLHEEALRRECQAKGWLHQPRTQKRLTQGLPRRNLEILTRLRTNCRRGTYQKRTCECGHPANLQHILAPCQDLQERTQNLDKYAKDNSLTSKDFLLPHPNLGLEPARALSSAIIRAKITSWF